MVLAITISSLSVKPAKLPLYTPEPRSHSLALGATSTSRLSSGKVSIISVFNYILRDFIDYIAFFKLCDQSPQPASFIRDSISSSPVSGPCIDHRHLTNTAVPCLVRPGQDVYRGRADVQLLPVVPARQGRVSGADATSCGAADRRLLPDHGHTAGRHGRTHRSGTAGYGGTQGDLMVRVMCNYTGSWRGS